MLRAATGRAFEVLLIDDLSRLSRDQIESERVIRRLEFQGIRIIAVSDGYDSTSRSAARKIQRGVKGLMNEMRLDELREQVHRGLEGQAIKKFWAGGRPYGYKLVQVTEAARLDVYGKPEVIGTRLEVDADTAPIVGEIFRRYADEWSLHRPARPGATADQGGRRSGWRAACRRFSRMSSTLAATVGTRRARLETLRPMRAACECGRGASGSNTRCRSCASSPWRSGSASRRAGSARRR
jgi:hypothetical protein